MSLKHNPELIPLTRIFMDKKDTSPIASATSTVSNSSFNSSSALIQRSVLTQNEIEYINIRAQRDSGKQVSFPGSFEVTKEMEIIYERFKQAAKSLSNEIDPDTIFDMSALTNCGPYLLGSDKNIQLFVLSTNNDLIVRHSDSGDEKHKRSFLDRVFKKQVETPTSSSPMMKYNTKYFELVGLNLFEALHHNTYNLSSWTNFRREVEFLSSNDNAADLNSKLLSKSNNNLNKSESEMQKVNTDNALVALKKNWNLNSWVLKIIQDKDKIAHSK